MIGIITKDTQFLKELQKKIEIEKTLENFALSLDYGKYLEQEILLVYLGNDKITSKVELVHALENYYLSKVIEIEKDYPDHENQIIVELYHRSYCALTMNDLEFSEIIKEFN